MLINVLVNIMLINIPCSKSTIIQYMKHLNLWPLEKSIYNKISLHRVEKILFVLSCKSKQNFLSLSIFKRAPVSSVDVLRRYVEQRGQLDGSLICVIFPEGLASCLRADGWHARFEQNYYKFCNYIHVGWNLFFPVVTTLRFLGNMVPRVLKSNLSLQLKWAVILPMSTLQENQKIRKLITII